MIFAEITPGSVASSSSARRMGSTLPAIGDGGDDELAGRVTDDSSFEMGDTAAARRRGARRAVLQQTGRKGVSPGRILASASVQSSDTSSGTNAYSRSFRYSVRSPIPSRSAAL